MADYVAKNLFTNEAEIKQLAKRNRNAALRVYDRIREWSAKVNGDNEKEFLLRAQRLYEKALRETRGTAGESERQNDIYRSGNKAYAKATRQVIRGKNPEQWGNQVTNYINEELRNGRDVTLRTDDGDDLVFTRDTAGKAQFREDDMSDELYRAKLNAAIHIDEIAKISKRGGHNVANRKPKHKKIARNGWNRRTAYFEDFDDKYYRLSILVPDGDYGKVVYHIEDIKEESKPNLEWFIDSEIDRPRGSKADNSVAFSNASIPKTNANGNTSGENVTQLQQSKRQMAYTDESDELFAKPVYSKPPLSKEDLEAQYEAEKAYNREARESALFSQAEESDAAEDLSDRDAVLEEFWAETHQEGPEDIEASREEYEQFWRDFQVKSDELAAETGIKTGMEDLAAFLASEREITEEANIARKERARGKVAFSEGAAESDANAFTRDMLNGRGKDGFDRAQKNAAYAMGKAVGKITWADSTAFDEAAEEMLMQDLPWIFPLTVNGELWYNFFGMCRENTQRRYRNVQTNPGLSVACPARGGCGDSGLCGGKTFGLDGN